MYEILFKVGQWLVNLEGRKIVIGLLSIITCYLIYERQDLKAENDRLDTKLTNSSRGNDSVVSIYRKELQRCDSLRFTDVQKTADKYEKTIEKLEAQRYEDYKILKQINR